MNNEILPDDKDLLSQMKEDEKRAVVLSEEECHNVASPAQTSDLQAQYDSQFQSYVENIYSQMAGDNATVPISVLLEGGVTSDHFQQVCDTHPDIITQIGGGPTLQSLQIAADRQYAKVLNSDNRGGGCFGGVQQIHAQAHCDSLKTGMGTDTYLDYKNERSSYQGSSNGGCSGFVALESSGDYITVSIPNTAYGIRGGRSSESCVAMNQQIANLQPGVTVTVDDITDYQMRMRMGNTPGGQYGHSAVKTSQPGKFVCDIAQDGFNFTRYGEDVHICYPKDAQVDKQTALLLIAQSREGRWQPSILSSNVIIPQAKAEPTHQETIRMSGKAPVSEPEPSHGFFWNRHRGNSR